MYVATAVGTVTNDSATGTIEVDSIDNGVEKEVFFKYKGADTVMRSALIPVKNISYIKAVAAADMEDKLKKVVVTFDDDVNGGEPIVGQDYVLNIALRQFYGMSDEDQYFKFGCVHVTSGMTKAQFFTKMAESLEKNFSREAGTYLTFKGNADNLEISEVAQPWARGLYAQERVYFDVIPGMVYEDGSEVQWGVTQETGKTKDSKGDDCTDCGNAGVVKNGYKLADLEYFCMGERGDIYRGMGWPNIVPTTYLLNPTADTEYNVLEIHFAFTDSGAESYKSEKDITIVAEDAATINSIVTALNTASGLSVASLS